MIDPGLGLVARTHAAAARRPRAQQPLPRRPHRRQPPLPRGALASARSGSARHPFARRDDGDLRLSRADRTRPFARSSSTSSTSSRDPTRRRFATAPSSISAAAYASACCTRPVTRAVTRSSGSSPTTCSISPTSISPASGPTTATPGRASPTSSARSPRCDRSRHAIGPPFITSACSTTATAFLARLDRFEAVIADRERRLVAYLRPSAAHAGRDRPASLRLPARGSGSLRGAHRDPLDVAAPRATAGGRRGPRGRARPLPRRLRPPHARSVSGR